MFQSTKNKTPSLRGSKSAISHSTCDYEDGDCEYDEDDDYSSFGDGSPIRSIRCLKNKEDMARFDEEEDCYVLDFDPFEPVGFAKLSLSDSHTPDLTQRSTGNDTKNNDLLITGEKGQVACRDYPHPRHLCVNFPFGTMPHEKCCDKCYCYVCDRKAPCALWISSDHCHATEHDVVWKQKRENRKQKQPSPITRQAVRGSPGGLPSGFFDS